MELWNEPERDRQIYLSRKRGERFSSIAKRYKLSAEGVRKIFLKADDRAMRHAYLNGTIEREQDPAKVPFIAFMPTQRLYYCMILALGLNRADFPYNRRTPLADSLITLGEVARVATSQDLLHIPNFGYKTKRELGAILLRHGLEAPIGL